MILPMIMSMVYQFYIVNEVDYIHSLWQFFQERVGMH